MDWFKKGIRRELEKNGLNCRNFNEKYNAAEDNYREIFDEDFISFYDALDFCVRYWNSNYNYRAVFLNTSIITADGEYALETISQEEAHNIYVNANCALSAIGHESTATIMSELLYTEIPVNRIQYEQEKNDICIVLKLNGRPPEGKILSSKEIEEIGYTFKKLIRKD